MSATPLKLTQFCTLLKLQGSQANGDGLRVVLWFCTLLKLQGSQANAYAGLGGNGFCTLLKLQGSQATESTAKPYCGFVLC